MFENIRSTVHQFLCRGESIFLEGGVYLSFSHLLSMLYNCFQLRLKISSIARQIQIQNIATTYSSSEPILPFENTHKAENSDSLLSQQSLTAFYFTEQIATRLIMMSFKSSQQRLDNWFTSGSRPYGSRFPVYHGGGILFPGAGRDRSGRPGSLVYCYKSVFARSGSALISCLPRT